MMQIGIVGKTNTGKSTFFSAATMVDAEIANRPFVTIKPNQGTSYVRLKCACQEFKVTCNPVNSKCINGERLIPITLLDVAGLVPDAWQGKGLGNQFMNDLMQAKALVHVLDTSGLTDLEGNFVVEGIHEPAEDVKFLEREINFWLKSILAKNWHQISKKASMEKTGPYQALAQQLSGLGINEDDVKEVMHKGNFSERPDTWNDDDLLRFAELIRKKSKPMIIAANKMDLKNAQANLEKLRKEFGELIFVPCCAEAELALRKAEKAGIISYVPGDKDFKILKELPEKQKEALEFIRKNVMEKFNGTGVQELINKSAFELLNLIAIYPVQDANKLASGKGNVLPDTFLVPKGTTAIELAGIIHTDFVDKFVAAVDCRSGKKIGKDSELHHNDVVKIQLHG